MAKLAELQQQVAELKAGAAKADGPPAAEMSVDAEDSAEDESAEPRWADVLNDIGMHASSHEGDRLVKLVSAPPP